MQPLHLRLPSCPLDSNDCGTATAIAAADWHIDGGDNTAVFGNGNADFDSVGWSDVLRDLILAAHTASVRRQRDD